MVVVVVLAVAVAVEDVGDAAVEALDVVLDGGPAVEERVLAALRLEVPVSVEVVVHPLPVGRALAAAAAAAVGGARVRAHVQPRQRQHLVLLVAEVLGPLLVRPHRAGRGGHRYRIDRPPLLLLLLDRRRLVAVAAAAAVVRRGRGQADDVMPVHVHGPPSMNSSKPTRSDARPFLSIQQKYSSYYVLLLPAA